MKSRIGKHVARFRAAKEEPSPITGLRDMLATAFAADIAAVTPTVCDVMREDMLAMASPARRDLIRTAIDVLGRNAGVLALEVAQMFRARFDAKLLATVDAASKRKRSAFELTLMDESLLEIDIAIEQCSARLKEQSSAEMFQLTARMAAMMDKPSLDDAENPIVPRVFASTFMDALGKMDLHNGQRLAVFKAFGPPLLHIAPDLYNHANGLLAECGVLPDFAERYGRPVNSRPIPAAARQADPILADEKALAAILDRLLNGGRAPGRGIAEQFAIAL